jgi:hypothetical protein
MFVSRMMKAKLKSKNCNGARHRAIVTLLAGLFREYAEALASHLALG